MSNISNNTKGKNETVENGSDSNDSNENLDLDKTESSEDKTNTPKNKGITGDDNENIINNDENQDIDNKKTEYDETISELREEKLRLLAEMENLRKRSEKEKLESIQYGSSNLVRDILSTNDNLTRALDSIYNEKNLTEPIKNLINGLKMVQKEFNTILEKHGVKKIISLDKKFDHNLHQAMLEVESEAEEGTVVQEIQSGYTMYDRLLRPAMVGVAKKPQKTKKKNK
tara:strand:+ start:639 stop:1322 length:684 start_codon:yes stop_codon:yes gene_type:complete